MAEHTSRSLIENLEGRRLFADLGDLIDIADDLGIDVDDIPGVDIPGSDASVSEVVHENRRKYGSPGLIAAVMKDGKLDEMAASGVREAGKSERVRWGDQMLIASGTKAMTATLAARIVERGYIKWDTTILDVFPGYAGKIRPTYYGVTLEQLLAHRGGMQTNLSPELTVAVALEDDPMTARGNYLRSMLRMKAAEVPGDYQYSNLGYIVAGAMMEQLMREPYENMMRRLVFEPLGITSAGFGWPGSADRLDAPRPHSITGQPQEPDSILGIPGAYNPSGGVHINIIDWAKFVGVQLGQAPRRFLSAATIDKLSDPYGGRDNGYGLGWNNYGQYGFEVIQHDGTEGFWYSSVVAVPEKDTAILVMSNRGGLAGERAAHGTIFDLQAKLYTD